MAGEPNELPEGGEGGGGGVIPRFPPELPQELPQAERFSQLAVVQELLRVRNRLHVMENAAFIQTALPGAAAMRARFNPAELPEGGEGGGGGWVGEFPGEWPQELPVDNDRFTSLQAQISQLTQLVTQLSEQVKQFQR